MIVVRDEPAAVVVTGPPFVRFGNCACVAVVGLICVILVVMVWPDAPVALLVSVLAVPSLWFGVRAARLGVVCDRSALVVRGLFWSRRIPREAITDISADPAGEWLLPRVSWRARGRRRWSPLVAFWVSEDLLGVTHRAAAAGLRRLRLWRVHGIEALVPVAADEPLRAEPGLRVELDVVRADVLLDDVPFPFDAVDFDVRRGTVEMHGQVRLRPAGRLRRVGFPVTVTVGSVSTVWVTPDLGPLELWWDTTGVSDGGLVISSSAVGSVTLRGAGRRVHVDIGREPVPSTRR